MENSNLSKSTTGFGLALGLASVLNALLVVVKEKSPAVLTAMKHLTGHHWVTHCVVVVGLFLVAGAMLTKADVKLTFKQLLGAVAGGVASGGLIIAGFYLFAD